MNVNIHFFLTNIILLMVVLCLSCREEDINELQIKPGQYPFLVLIKVEKQGENPEYLNGCLASLRWVLTLSYMLAQLPTGLLKDKNLSVTVYAGIISTNDTRTAHNRMAISIHTNLYKNRNKHFPTLVLLKLESQFLINNNIRPVMFNIGMLATRSQIVGWSHHSGSSETLPSAVNFQVATKTFRQCGDWQLVQFKEQMCAYSYGSYPLLLGEGSLMVDNGYLTAIKQMDTYFTTSHGSTVAVFVRIGYYVPWVEMIANDPVVPQKRFLKTNNTDDDLTIEPWYIDLSSSTCLPEANMSCLFIIHLLALLDCMTFALKHSYFF